MNSIKNIKAIVFDLDGVFVNTEPIFFRAFRKVLEQIEIRISDQYIYGLVGDPTMKNLADIKRDYETDFDSELIFRKINNLNKEMIANLDLKTQGGILNIVKSGKILKLKFGLCTTSIKEHVNSVFDSLKESIPVNPYHLFHAIVTGEDVKKIKPHAEPYIKVAENLSVQPNECLVIEDSAVGIKSAKTAGCICYGLRQTYNEHIDFSIADRIVKDLYEANDCINQSFGKGV